MEIVNVLETKRNLTIFQGLKRFYAISLNGFICKD